MIARFLSNISAKYYKNPSMLSRVIAKNVGDVFFETLCILKSVSRPSENCAVWNQRKYQLMNKQITCTSCHNVFKQLMSAATALGFLKFF